MPGIARQFEPQITRTGGAPPSTASPLDARDARRRTPTSPARLSVTLASKATSRTAAGFSPAIAPMICVRLVWRDPTGLSNPASAKFGTTGRQTVRPIQIA